MFFNIFLQNRNIYVLLLAILPFLFLKNLTGFLFFYAHTATTPLFDITITAAALFLLTWMLGV